MDRPVQVVRRMVLFVDRNMPVETVRIKNVDRPHIEIFVEKVVIKKVRRIVKKVREKVVIQSQRTEENFL